MSGLDINWIDLAIILIFAFSIIVGFIKGFFRSIVSVLAWLAAIVISIHYGPMLSDKFTKVSSDPQTQLMLAYAVLFISVLIVGLLFKMIIEAIINFTGLSTTDRIMGGVFGLFRGVFVVTIAVFLMSLSSFGQGDIWKESKLVPYFMDIAAWVENMAPQDVQSKVAQHKAAAKEQVQDKAQAVNKAASNKVGGNLSD
ncbi:MAG: CvpA family protein [Gammaproteobacteria bacterium]|jgi:membrane protein required for colicin V production|nr:CvpA family protein [Gammaproteobacteria bacterium]